MKGFSLVYIFIFCSIVSGQKATNISLDYSDSSLLAEGIAVAINQVFSKEKATLNMIHANSLNSFILQDFMTEILSKTFKRFKVVIQQTVSEKLPSTLEERIRNVIISIQTFNDFLEIYSRLSKANINLNGLYFIVAVNDLLNQDLEVIFGLMWKLKITNVNVIFKDKSGKVAVKSFNPFKSIECSDTSAIHINEFRNKKFTNGIEDFFRDKTKNLSGCPIRVSFCREPMNFVKLLPNGSFEFSGRDIFIFKALSDKLNFRINNSFVGYCGSLNASGSRGALGSLLDSLVDITDGSWILTPDRIKYFDATTTVISTTSNFAIPPARDFTSFEKLIFPFSVLTWTLLCLCFLIGVFVIFIVNLKSTLLQEITFGVGVHNPYKNLFIGFIGGSQNVLPKGNSARFLLVIFFYLLW